MLYSSANAIADDAQVADPNYYPPFRAVDTTVVRRIMEELDALGDPDEEGLSGAHPALSPTHFLPLSSVCSSGSAHKILMLCVSSLAFDFILTRHTDINRMMHPSTSISTTTDLIDLPDPRILILSVSPDLSTSYIPIMNSIFSAQKLVSPCLSSPFSVNPLSESNHRCRQNLRT
jgi:transcription initiation factor TFIIH subunit 3